LGSEWRKIGSLKVMKISADKIEKDIIKQRDRVKAKNFARFFKTGKGEYGDGDLFLGISVPESRMLSKKYKDVGLKEISVLLKNKFHEIRLIVLFVLVSKFQEVKTETEREKIINFYLKHLKYVNNWDLVDSTAYQILGNYLTNQKDRKVLYKLASSKSIWEQRIAVVSTYAFIKKGESKDIFVICKKLFNHKHDLIHKAMGWMLREVGKNVNQKELKVFLKENIRQIPRTTLRYAIEKFEDKERRRYLNM
jgi:3-methyladenine DNA glycosylase AlkD